MKKTAKFGFLVFLMLVLIACNIPGCEADLKDQEYKYKLNQMAQQAAETEKAQSQGRTGETEPAEGAPVESQSTPINTEQPNSSSDAATQKMVFEGTGTVVNYTWGTEDIENSCTSEAKVTLTVEGDTCTTGFTYDEMGLGIDKVCFVLWEEVYLQATGTYSSVDGSCLFDTIKAPIKPGNSINGSGILMGSAKVDLWEQTDVENWSYHYYSDYLSPQP